MKKITVEISPLENNKLDIQNIFVSCKLDMNDENDNVLFNRMGLPIVKEQFDKCALDKSEIEMIANSCYLQVFDLLKEAIRIQSKE